MSSQAATDPAFLMWSPPTWNEAVGIATNMRGWVFRGQAQQEWRLETTLERLAKAQALGPDKVPDRERNVVEHFQRQSHQYLPQVPEKNDYLEWLTIIQHYGGPTRLLDFTRSFYVAMFFALESATEYGTVWAINERALDTKYIGCTDLIPEGSHAPTLAASKRYVANQCIGRSFGTPFEPPIDAEEAEPNAVLDVPNVVAVEPWNLNQRIVIQQGLFLLPTDLDRSFEENLCKGLGFQYAQLPMKTPVPTQTELVTRLTVNPNDLALLRIDISPQVRRTALADLHRMNITAATLFPGLDGFARSLLLYPFDDQEAGPASL